MPAAPCYFFNVPQSSPQLWRPDTEAKNWTVWVKPGQVATLPQPVGWSQTIGIILPDERLAPICLLHLCLDWRTEAFTKRRREVREISRSALAAETLVQTVFLRLSLSTDFFTSTKTSHVNVLRNEYQRVPTAMKGNG